MENYEFYNCLIVGLGNISILSWNTILSVTIIDIEEKVSVSIYRLHNIIAYTVIIFGFSIYFTL